MNRFEGKPDAELLELALAGEEGAFLVLYEHLKMPIFRYAFHMTSSKYAAEEITQEVFISLLKSGNRYKASKGDFPGFVFGIARNFVRRLRKRKHVYEPLASGEGLERLAGGQPQKEGLSAQLIRAEGVERVRTAIASLPDRYRQVVVLCDLCEFTYMESATRLRCAVGTVRSRLNRAHALLAHKLKQSNKPQPESPAAGTEECLI